MLAVLDVSPFKPSSSCCPFLPDIYITGYNYTHKYIHIHIRSTLGYIHTYIYIYIYIYIYNRINIYLERMQVLETRDVVPPAPEPVLDPHTHTMVQPATPKPYKEAHIVWPIRSAEDGQAEERLWAWAWAIHWAPSSFVWLG